MREKYSTQPWYRGDGIYELEAIHKEKHIPVFGTDCTWINFKTNERISIWDRCMVEMTDDESKKLIREHNLDKILYLC